MSAALRKSKTIEQIYQKKSQLEHILLRPDTYIGSIEVQRERLWVWDDVKQKIIRREINFVPGLYKIFDEILVNACDNFQRDPGHMTYIKVNINEQEGWISIENNGATLPVEIHKEHKMYVPEMVFGHLLTSDNYDDDENKVTGGRNGYGAKLTNIFSTKFVIECGDGKRGQKYVQTWEKNMGEKGKAHITKYSGKDFTKVTFYPDLKRFGMSKLDQDVVALMKKRVMDAGGSTDKKCRVFLNDSPVAVKEFKDYVDLYFEKEQPRVYDKFGDRWEFVVTTSEGQFQQVSFVNSINTIKGGTHVTHVTDQFVESILDKVNKKNRGGMEIKPFHVRSHLWVFVNCLIVNPTFDSQTKETMTLKQSKFGSKCEVPEKAIKQLFNMGIVDTVLQWAKARESIDMKKKMKGTGRASRLLGIPKLEDANWAGTRNSEECTLILTEGDSAKALAVAGLSIVGRDRFGVFPLRGKPLNVRDANFQQTVNNAEIQNIIQILGLEQQKVYDSVKSLRYGSVMIMADQDYDGSHIKGLLLNMFQHWWPSLFKLEGFVKEFITPIVKVSKGSQELQFFSVVDYEAWKEKSNGGKGWTTKYYKGLGTSTAKEGKEYFKNIRDHRMFFKWTGARDDELIDLAFNKKRADDRKAWINSYEEGRLIDHTQQEVSYKDFVDKELVLFAKANVSRAIPSMVDGFKPSQRKVLFGCFKRKLKNDVKVAQLVGYVSEHAAYHHGEMSLSETIVGMAQDFVGSNNINLLVPQGQFGTRLQGGKDSASARYIYTRLAPITRAIFPASDDQVLDFLHEDGMTIEPRWYCPVIPMVLVNGVEGIGTGWSSSVPNFNPRDIIDNLRRWLKKQEMREMIPWFAGFTGKIAKSREEGKWEVTGTVRYLGDSKAEITELPVKRWTQDYREILEENLPKGEKKKEGVKLLEDYQEYHSEKTVHFELSLSAEGTQQAEKDNLEKVFKLRSSISMNNMMLFDAEGKIKKYDTPVDVMKDFAQVRLQIYEKRKAHLLARLTRECEILSAKARFVKLVIEGKIVIRKRKIADLAQDLRKHGFKPLQELKDESTEEKEEEEEADGEEDDEGSEGEEAADVTKKAVKDFEYLVGMPISSLTAEKVAKLMQEHEAKAAELNELKRKKPSDLWLEDLQMLEIALDEREAVARDEEEKERAKIQKAKAKSSRGKSLKRSASGPPSGKEEKPRAKAKARAQSAGARGLKRSASGPAQ
mmetsp:Transcript_21100/g.49104  ORF Transcript_21100/g.49104 Transcript_21100/m.49104 type:complete len:1219 (+) Transcript_21100:71-3727(+)